MSSILLSFVVAVVRWLSSLCVSFLVLCLVLTLSSSSSLNVRAREFIPFFFLPRSQSIFFYSNLLSCVVVVVVFSLLRWLDAVAIVAAISFSLTNFFFIYTDYSWISTWLYSHTSISFEWVISSTKSVFPVSIRRWLSPFHQSFPFTCLFIFFNWLISHH